VEKIKKLIGTELLERSESYSTHHLKKSNLCHDYMLQMRSFIVGQWK